MTHPYDDDNHKPDDNAFNRLCSLPNQVLRAHQHPLAVFNTVHAVPGGASMSAHLVALLRERRN